MLHATVTYYELSFYNEGTLISKTFDIGNVTESEHESELQDWLDELSEEHERCCEEWIIADIDGVPDCMYDEWNVYSDWFDVADMAAHTHMSFEAIMAGVELGIPTESIEDAYYGEFDSDEEFAEEYVESTGMLSEVPDSLQSYFDIERFASDLMFDFMESDGHYFSQNW